MTREVIKVAPDTRVPHMAGVMEEPGGQFASMLSPVHTDDPDMYISIIRRRHPRTAGRNGYQRMMVRTMEWSARDPLVSRGEGRPR